MNGEYALKFLRFESRAIPEFKWRFQHYDEDWGKESWEENEREIIFFEKSCLKICTIRKKAV
ncbi:MAG: hypothetical protein K2M83_08660, partial [Muribaculaceae bacterium]|nr:hypothetical protein [Muribaculaceae bacterium]